MIVLLEETGIINTGTIHHNLSVSELIERAVQRKEGILTAKGALCIETGKYTGRSPKDRFIVDEPSINNEIAWGKVNMPISIQKFVNIYNRMTAYLQNKDLFVFDGFAGADPKYRTSFRVINEYACQNLFIKQLLIRPTSEELKTYKNEFTILCAPGFKCNPEIDGTNSEAAIIISLEKKMILIAGSMYCGEIKKSVFSVMNYLLPKKDVLPMHCSANVGDNEDVALFFGLSGTGKTTLSADPNRRLIGDDEHGWSPLGVFNFEGGCYAKTINLSEEKEPEIWNAIKFGTILENVVVNNKDRIPNFEDNSLTENTRAGYPINYIDNALIPGTSNAPKNIIFLTADAFGVLPPIAKLTKESAMYHFLSGYTSKLAGTERGITEPQATFSTAFGEPFLPINPIVYANMLGKRIDDFNVNVYLINTGWTGGPYGIGNRMNLKYTRNMVTAVLKGDLKDVKYELDPIFNILIPIECPNVPVEILNPINTWEDKEEYNKKAIELARKFKDNFEQFEDIPEKIVNAGPSI
ncbi:phosphoenolpyruvate carboxykinase (ATP) [Desulfonispora thiosulfatigenes]|nr:phosphoenolpyruvate carboxykinase (ATP) [Desulfonispora thiosulfatigenes]